MSKSLRITAGGVCTAPLLALNRLVEKVSRFDHRNRWFGAGRTIMAAGPLVTLLVTPMKAFVVPVAASDGARCDSIRSVSVLCVGGNTADTLELRRWILIAMFAVVAVGIYPRLTCLLHVWAAYTMAISVTLPDGGDAIGLIISLLILPLALTDGRRWHWTAPTSELDDGWRAVAWIGSYAIRAEIAYIYLDSAISKFGVQDWSSGTAEYYIMRDRAFGVAGPLRGISLWLSGTNVGLLALTWGAIVIEIVIGWFLLSSYRWRLAAWAMDLLLHIMIIATMGLFSFAVVMMGAATVAANPSLRHPLTETDRKLRPRDIAQDESWSASEPPPVLQSDTQSSAVAV